MASKARAAKTSKSEGGGKKGSKRDPPQKSEKTDSSGSASTDESEVKKSTLVKDKVDRPKKGKSDREVDRDEDNDGRDEKKKEGDRDKRILSMIEKLEEKLEQRFLQLLSSVRNDMKIGRNNQKEKSHELEAMIKEVKKSLSMRMEKLEKGLDASKEDVGRLRESLQFQLENLQPTGKADDGWKEVEESMMAELKLVKSKLEKRIKKKDNEEVIDNLKKEVSDLKKMFEVKLKEVSKISTPVKYSTPMKAVERPNNGWWRSGKESHSPVHSPEKDWWRGKRKWTRPVWCDTHRWGAHATSMCWKKKKIWRIKQVVGVDVGGSVTGNPTTKE